MRQFTIDKKAKIIAMIADLKILKVLFVYSCWVSDIMQFT